MSKQVSTLCRNIACEPLGSRSPLIHLHRLLKLQLGAQLVNTEPLQIKTDPLEKDACASTSEQHH